ncbi:hypothetical protein IEE94_06105 [Yimella sp. cx-573]|nr:hypothetical protein [Yimella sp. cx-573]
MPCQISASHAHTCSGEEHLRELHSALGVAALSLTVGLTGCGSDDKKDDATNAASSAAGQTSADNATTSAAEGSGKATAAPGGVNQCTLKFKGKDAEATAVGLSCEDASGLWQKFSKKDQDMANEDVQLNGETFKCSVIGASGKHTASCFVGKKALSLNSGI